MKTIDLLWFLTVVGLINCEGVVRLVVMNGSDVVLPCSLDNKDIGPALFDWTKDGQQEVFLYDAGTHYNNGRLGQDEQFKGRVSHFPDELINGNASIIIRNTRPSDSGNYTCYFPHIQQQRFHIELLVGASPRPFITLHKRNDGMLLQCEVLGASPKPVVEWWDSDGNILPADQPKITERGGNKYDVFLNVIVTKTGFYRCVSTQKKINHQIETKTRVVVAGDNMAYTTVVLIAGCCCLGLFLVLAAVLINRSWKFGYIRRVLRKRRDRDKGSDLLPRLGTHDSGMDSDSSYDPGIRDSGMDSGSSYDPEQPLTTEEDTEPGVATVEPDEAVTVHLEESTE